MAICQHCLAGRAATVRATKSFAKGNFIQSARSVASAANSVRKAALSANSRNRIT